MREILFRGKSLTGKWFEGAYYKQEEFYGDKEDAHVIITSKDTLDNDLGLLYSVVIPETIGQYTGLTDKNGKKIFEGDIVKIGGDNLPYWMENGELKSVEYISDGFSPFNEYDNDCGTFLMAKDCEVIGNIHDNPELLKSEVDTE